MQAAHVLCQRLLVAGLVLAGGHDGTSLWPFIIAMIGASLVYTSAFVVRFILLFRSTDNDADLGHYKCMADLFPVHPTHGIDTERWSLARGFLRHSLVKQLLTDGAAYVMTVFDALTFAEQGVYDAIEKLGSLVARIVLAPLEESAYVYFTRNIDRRVRAAEQDGERLRTATSVLRNLLHCTAVMGLVVCTFGMSYAWLALYVYGGANLTGAGSECCLCIHFFAGARLLRVYCAYVVLLAVNGIGECFMFATLLHEQVRRHERFLTLVAVVYVPMQVLLAAWIGAVGFLAVNCVNMIARIAYRWVTSHSRVALAVFGTSTRTTHATGSSRRSRRCCPTCTRSPCSPSRSSSRRSRR